MPVLGFLKVQRLTGLTIEKTMNIDQAKKIVISVISKILEGKSKITEDMQLIGGESLLDSMKLVEVCIALEDLADEQDLSSIGRQKRRCRSHIACLEVLLHLHKSLPINRRFK